MMIFWKLGPPPEDDTGGAADRPSDATPEPATTAEKSQRVTALAARIDALMEDANDANDEDDKPNGGRAGSHSGIEATGDQSSGVPAAIDARSSSGAKPRQQSEPIELSGAPRAVQVL